MKGETNIAEILRGCPKGTRVYNDETKQLIGTNRPYNKTESND